MTELRTISYTTNFYNNNDDLLLTQKCDFRIENASVNFKTCPIIAEVLCSGMQHRFDINSITSVDLKLIAPNAFPKNLLNAENICAHCVLRHHENSRGSN